MTEFQHQHEDTEQMTKDVNIAEVTQYEQTIALTDITLSDDHRLRDADDTATVDRYAETFEQYLADIAAGTPTPYPFPAAIILREGDTNHLLGGRLRYQAAVKAGVKVMPCIVYTDRQDAIRAALESNRHHGLPLGRKDLVCCIKLAVTQLGNLSNRMIADLIGCSDAYVGKVIKKYQLRTSSQLTQGRDGRRRCANRQGRKSTQTPTDTSNESGTQKPPETDQPETGLGGTSGVLDVQTPETDVPEEDTQTPDQVPEPETPSDPPVDHVPDDLKSALEKHVLHTADRLGTCVGVVKWMLSEGLTDEHRRDFQQRLESMMSEFRA